jgi:uncharacterized protein (DUF924 family)
MSNLSSLVTAELRSKIYNYWLEGLQQTPTAAIPFALVKRWFMAKPEDDQEIHQLFHQDLLRLSEQFTHVLANSSKDAFPELQWDQSEDIQSLLSSVILFDQVPRNVFRGTDKAFAYDALSRKILQWSQMTKKADRIQRIPLNQRLFVILVRYPFCIFQNLKILHPLLVVSVLR